MSVAPDPSIAAIQRATALCELRRFPEAVTLLSGVVASDPQNAHAWCVMSQAQIGQRRFQDGLDAATRASSLAPDAEWPHRLMSLASGRLGYHAYAADRAKEAVRLAPHEWRTHVRLADARRSVPDLDGAQSAVQRALELAPDQPDAHMVSGTIALAAGRRRAAGECFRQVLALDPDNTAAHNALARTQLRRRSIANVNPGRLASAAGGFAAAVRTDPTSDASRRALDTVLWLFLRRLAYFVFVDAFIASATQGSSSSSTRLIPIVLLVLPVGFALWFIFRVPRTLRPYLLTHALTEGKWIATVLESVALAAIVASTLSPAASKATLIGIALAGALIARFVLWTLSMSDAR